MKTKCLWTMVTKMMTKTMPYHYTTLKFSSNDKKIALDIVSETSFDYNLTGNKQYPNGFCGRDKG